MKNFYRCLVFCILLIPAALTARAQVAHEDTDPIESQIKLYGVKKASPVLFVHLDKTIYTNNETVWFTGYLLNIDANTIKEHRILSVSLINDENSKIAAQANFILDGGLSFGNIYIPDSVTAGSYHFVAYTNRLQKGQPEVVFKQSVTIKTTNEPAFSLSLSLLDSTKAQVQSKGIYTNKEFYVVDYDTVKDNIPEYQSAIYWKYNVPVTSSGETSLWFFTNDITGRFRIIAQGVTQEGVLYSEQTFNVKKKLP